MSVPDIPQYQEAVRRWKETLNPDDPKCALLREGRPTRREAKRAGTLIEEPVYWNGDWAVVYRFETSKGVQAVRCQRRRSQLFMEQVELRYRRLSEEFVNALPPSFVHVDTVTHGLEVLGERRPLILMDWVEGTHTNRFLYTRLAEGDFWSIREVAQKFMEALLDLELRRVAHGDLQDRNILITAKNELKLIDYDSVYCESIRKSFDTNLQPGHDNYQHPLRTPTDFDPSLDRFSALVILLSLVTAYRQPALWVDVVAPGGDPHDQQMLFVKTDYLDPERSEMFRRLLQVDDAYLRALTEITIRACHARSLAEVPPLREVLRKVPGALVKDQYRVPPLNPNLRVIHPPDPLQPGEAVPPRSPLFDAETLTPSGPGIVSTTAAGPQSAKGKLRIPIAPEARPLTFSTAGAPTRPGAAEPTGGSSSAPPIPPPPPPGPKVSARAPPGPSQGLLRLGLAALLATSLLLTLLTQLELTNLDHLVGIVVAFADALLALPFALRLGERRYLLLWVAVVAVQAALLALWPLLP